MPRAAGRSYVAPTGYEYRYQGRSYYRSVSYPPHGTPEFWILANDPYYFPNYSNPVSPWYNHPYPEDFEVEDGELIAADELEEGGINPLWFIIPGVLAIAGALGGFLFWRRREY